VNLTGCCFTISTTGESFVCAFDPVGSAERLSAACTGAGAQIIQPLLDSYSAQLRGGVLPTERTDRAVETIHDVAETPVDKDEVQEVCEFVQRCFRAAAERDIAVGGSVQICVITPAGTSRHLDKYEPPEAPEIDATSRTLRDFSLELRVSAQQAPRPDD
jgi:20S proteasome alpha/beta subunit